MPTIHTPWAAVHDEWTDLEVDGYTLAAPAKITDTTGTEYAVWSGAGLTAAHAAAVAAAWPADALELAPPPPTDPAPAPAADPWHVAVETLTDRLGSISATTIAGIRSELRAAADDAAEVLES